MAARVQHLALGYPEGRLELQLVGGFTDPHRYSDELFANIMPLAWWWWLNGVLADECPTSVRALLASHPGYRDAAAQLLAAAARVVPPPGLLYVGQRELAAVVPHDKNVNIIGSDDATSCIIVVLRHSG
ncbi:hypothetical protein ACJJTC_002107 [Scirpophaga incertulas]